MSPDDLPLYASLSGTRTEVARVPITPEFAARYELVRLLGAGMMGCVYLAKSRAGGFVAVKFLMDPTADPQKPLVSPMLRERFVREARLMAALKHPHVVQVLDADCLGPHPYLVCEFVDGGTLRAKLDREVTLAPALAVRLMVELLAGLAVCHESGFVHRDLKPDNILLDAAGHLKISDLGLAKDYGDGTHLTRTGAIMGTPLYMAPEQARGESAVVASDLYAVGVMLYEMLAGRPPFLALSFSELLKAHREGTPPPLAELAPATPPALVAAIERALAKDPAARPGSALALATALERSLKPGAAPSRPAATAPRPQRTGLYAGLALTTVVLVAASAMIPGRAPERLATPAPVASTSAPKPPTPADTAARLHRELEESTEELAPWPGTDRAPLVATCLSATARAQFVTGGALTLPAGRVVAGAAELAATQAGLVEGVNWLAIRPPGAPSRVTLVRESCPLRPQQRTVPPPEGVLHARITYAMQANPLEQLPALRVVAEAVPDAADPFRRAMQERIEIDGAQNMIQLSAITEQLDFDPVLTDPEHLTRIRHALGVLQEALGRDSTRWDAWHDTGAMLRRVGALAQARIAFVHALMIWPEAALTWRDLGRLERRRWMQLKAAHDVPGARRHLAAALVAYENAVACDKLWKTREHMITSAEAVAELAEMRRAAR